MAAKKTRGKMGLGQRMLRDFTELHEVLRSGQPLEKFFTVRTVELDLKPRPFDAEAVRVIRLRLGVSQAVFARLLDVSKDLVSAWEQGCRTPSGPACRLLELMADEPDRWRQLLRRRVKVSGKMLSGPH